MRPLTPNTRRTLPLNDALVLAISTLPDLAEGEAVELDVRHAPVDTPICIVRAPLDQLAAERLLAAVVLAVEEGAPTVTHATVKRYVGVSTEAEQTNEAEASEE
jgi:hypothetical protein